MTADLLVDKNFPFLKLTDSVQDSLDVFEDQNTELLPVLDKEVFTGFLSLSIVENSFSVKKIEDIVAIAPSAKVLESAHVFEVMHIMDNNKLDIVAVVDVEDDFKGIISKKDIGNFFINVGFAQVPGGILVLEVAQNNYSLSEISRIVESNDIKIVSVFTENDKEENSILLVTLKLNKDDLTRLIASFERFGYKIVADFHESAFQKFDTERYELLMKFLNI